MPTSHDALLAALVEQLEVELPETLVQEEIISLLEQTAGQLAQQGMDVKKLFTPQLIQSLRETSRPEAEERLKRSLALKALASAEKIEVAADEIEAKVKELSRGFSENSRIDPARLRQAVQEDLMREKLMGWLESNSTITEKAPEAEGDQPKTAEPVKAKDGFVLPAPAADADRRTEAEKRHEARLAKLEEERLRKQAAKGYRDRVKDFNEHLASLSEHHDIPKVGPG